MVSMTGQALTSSDRELEVETDGVTVEKAVTCARWRSGGCYLRAKIVLLK